ERTEHRQVQERIRGHNGLVLRGGGAQVRIIAIIQARLNSTRLPRKVLADIAGRPMIDHVIERARAIRGIDRVVLNIPLGDHELDRPEMTYQIAYQEADVLGSFLKIADLEGADILVRLTGDCPLLAPDLSSEVLQLFLKEQPDYYANTNPP